jgi:BirA family biotin operon repressor/biotin-[acetyl-CoA-carboxylase] ligase
MVPPMTLAIGIGLCDAVRSFGAPAHLKWPNDLLVDGKKLAGVLVEAQSQGPRLEAVIVGIGLNLAGELPAEVASTATTLEQAAGPIDREQVLQRLLEHVEHWIDHYVAGGLPAVNGAWEERMAKHLIARASTLANTVIEGEMAGLDGDGSLLLRDDTGNLHRVRSGTIESVLPAC